MKSFRQKQEIGEKNLQLKSQNLGKLQKYFLKKQSTDIMVKFQHTIVHVLGARAFSIFKKSAPFWSNFGLILSVGGTKRMFFNEGGKIVINV